ncbi:MAG: glycosyltransferase family 4 protein [Acidobacteriota bacterium]
MRVTYLMRCLAMMRGGGETQHLAWIRALAPLGVDIEVITGRPLIKSPVYPSEPDVPTVTLRSPYARDFVYRAQHWRGFGRLTMWSLHADEEWFCRLAFARIAASPRQPDLVLAHALHQAPRLAPGSYPVAVYLPGPPHLRYIPDLQRADALISDGWAAKQLPTIVGRPVDDVLKGVDVELFAPNGPEMRRRHGLEGRRVVICVTRLVPIKNLPMMIEAVASLRRSLPSLMLVLVGEGPQQAALEARARELGVGEEVRFVGYVPQAETAAWYRSADVFALSSDFDNSPNVVLEAMACGLPIVATDVGGLREYVSPGIGGLLTPKGDAAAFAGALKMLLEDPARRATIGRHNRQDAVTRFSWAASATRMREVYARVIAEFGRGGRASVQAVAS